MSYFVEFRQWVWSQSLYATVGYSIMDKNKCLGCGVGLEVGEICIKCLYDGISITKIHSKYNKSRIIGYDGQLYSIWCD